MSSRRDIILGWGKGWAKKKKKGILKFGKKILEEFFKLLKTLSMVATVIFHILLLFSLKHQRVVSRSCFLTILILLPLLLLPIEIEMRKGRSLSPCGGGGGEGVV
ncbi:hypothetical protein ES332_A06G210600v1 [Gossypium tomentosum]|uniref:Uncharacterized protein n=1 Tax=Gossypium tomentosum TaxID=34277 RepID=A0A5D2Q6L0_GOSTO|nr:hypothetical protein ES332_A06G210600v1 [Gossypium tomentosum]